MTAFSLVLGFSTGQTLVYAGEPVPPGDKVNIGVCIDGSTTDLDRAEALGASHVLTDRDVK